MMLKPKVNGYPHQYNYILSKSIKIIISCYKWGYKDPRNVTNDVEAIVSVIHHEQKLICKTKNKGEWVSTTDFQIKLDQNNPYIFINGYCFTIEAKSLWNIHY